MREEIQQSKNVVNINKKKTLKHYTSLLLILIMYKSQFIETYRFK